MIWNPSKSKRYGVFFETFGLTSIMSLRTPTVLSTLPHPVPHIYTRALFLHIYSQNSSRFTHPPPKLRSPDRKFQSREVKLEISKKFRIFFGTSHFKLKQLKTDWAKRFSLDVLGRLKCIVTYQDKNY